MHKIILKNTKIKVYPTAIAYRESYPAANWIKEPTLVTLIEDAPGQGTLDIINVQLENGEIESIYDFNIKYNIWII